MKELLCFIFATFFLQLSFSQNTVDKISLKDSIEFIQYMDSGVFYLYKANNKLQSQKHFNEALSFSKKINYKQGIVKSYLFILNTDFDNYTFKDSILKQIEPYVINPNSKKDTSNLIIYYLNVSDVYLNNEEFKQSTNTLDFAMKLSNSSRDTLMLMNCYKQYMVINSKIKNNREVIKYGLKSLALNTSNKRTDNSDFNNGSAAQFVAKSYFRLDELDSSIFFYKKAGDYLINYPFYSEYNDILLLEVLNSKFKNQKDSLVSYITEEKTNKIFSKIKPSNANVYGQALIVLANSFSIANNKVKAKEFALQSLEFFKELGKKENELVALSLLVKLTDGEEKNDYFNKYSVLKEELYETQKAETILSLQEKFNLQEKEALLLKEQNKNLKTKTYIQFSLLLLLVLGVLIFVLFRYRVSKKNKQIEKLRKQALQLQMNPHFFFNTLNSINNFILENDKDKARVYLTKFSKLMRLTLENSQHEFIKIEKEVSFIENYLFLEQARKQNFDFEVNVSEDVLRFKIPPLLFQPLVENAIIHGFNDLPHKGKLVIEIKKKEKEIQIKVSDNGVGIKKGRVNIKEDNHTPMATKILKNRIKHYSKGVSQLQYKKGIEGYQTEGTSVMFNLPLVY